MSNKDFTADFSEGEHVSPGIHDAGIEPAKKNYEAFNIGVKAIIDRMKETGITIADLFQQLPPEAYEPTGQGEESIKELANKFTQLRYKTANQPDGISDHEFFHELSDGIVSIVNSQTSLLSRQLLRSEQNLKEAGERIGELESKESELSEVKKWIEIQREVVKAKDEQIVRLQELIWKAFLLSVCDLPESEQQGHWETFKKENGLPEALNPSSKTK